MTTRDERVALALFGERYAMPTSDVTALVEGRVIGAVWGANGYTTVEQADILADRLALAPGKRLLDLGTGRGWPGIYLAARSGCTLVGTDMPHDALLTAARRAAGDGLAGRVAVAAAAGEQQPFRPACFDAVVHTDVLCWLRRKLAVLRALNRLLRPGGRMAFTTIYVAPGLAPAANRRARRSGPRAVASRSDQARLLRSAGFVDVEELDVTDAYATTARAWLEESQAHAEELAAIEAPGAFEQRQRERRAHLVAIEDGLLRRGLFVAARPHGG